jgi:hypothetical protein
MIDDLDQVLFFAFEDAPEEVVRGWAREHDPALEEEAFRRVVFIRETMTNLGELWEAKSASIIPPLVGVKYDAIRDSDGRMTALALYLAAARITDLGRPDLTDSVRLRVQLWPADVDMLIGELARLREDHLDEQRRGGE